MEILKQVDHIGIAVKDLDSVKATYRLGFNLEPEFEETLMEQKVHVAGYRIGNMTVEFLEPVDDSSPIAAFLEKRGAGIHHIAYRVENLQQVLDDLKTRGFRLIDEKKRKGAEEKNIAFLHPGSFNGILIELSEYSD